MFGHLELSLIVTDYNTCWNVAVSENRIISFYTARKVNIKLTIIVRICHMYCDCARRIIIVCPSRTSQRITICLIHLEYIVSSCRKSQIFEACCLLSVGSKTVTHGYSNSFFRECCRIFSCAN